MPRCYCGHSGCGSTSSILKQPRPRSDLRSLTSSSRLSVQPQTQFIKRPHVRNNNMVELGFGHSHSGLNRDFSRRNSVSTNLSERCSSCCSSCGQQLQQQQQQQRESRVKVLSWGNGELSHNNNSRSNNNNSQCDYTDNRRFYEQRACAIGRLPACQGQGQTQGQGQDQVQQLHVPRSEPQQDYSDELQRLMSLQQFRLLNSSDCFSAQRQDELRLQNAYNKLTTADTDKWKKNRTNETRQQLLTPTPYALRQKLLQLQIQQDAAIGRGSGAVCAPMEPSCALRYNSQ